MKEKICKQCQNTFTTKETSKSNFCSPRCQNLWVSQHKTPTLIPFVGIKSISEIPEETLKWLHTKDLYEISNRLKKNGLFDILAEYREFRLNHKLCPNCSEFYEAKSISNADCPHCGYHKVLTKVNPNQIEKDKSQSKIYQILKDFNTFKDIPLSVLKDLRKHGRNQVMRQVKKFFPLIYEELKEHWDAYKFCPNCGDLFLRRSLGNKNLEYCSKSECQALYKEDIRVRNIQVRATCLEKFGVNWYSKTPEFLEKTKDTNPFLDLEKQKELFSKNVEKAGGYEAWIERQRQISKDYQNSLTAEDYAKQNEKREQTCLERHGVTNIFKKIENIPHSSKSKIGEKFLCEYEAENNVIIEREKWITSNGRRCRVDGFIAPNTIIEFLGDYWHGYSNDSTLNEKTKETAADLYAKTFGRFRDLSLGGYKIQYIWESEYSSLGLQALKEFKDE